MRQREAPVSWEVGRQQKLTSSGGAHEGICESAKEKSKLSSPKIADESIRILLATQHAGLEICVRNYPRSSILTLSVQPSSRHLARAPPL